MGALSLDRLETALGGVTAEQLVRLYLTRAALDGARLPPSDGDDLLLVCRWLSGGVADLSARCLLELLWG